MINNFEKFTVREIFGTFIPGLYFTIFIGKIIMPIFDLQKNDINSFDYFILFIVSTLIGLVIYSYDFPKRIYFFNNNTPTYLINKKIKNDNLSITEIDIRNAYFSFFDNNISSNQKVLTEKLTTLFHFSSNIFLCSIVVLIIELVLKYFNYAIIDSNMLFFNTIVVVLSLTSIFGLFYGKNKINNLFQRQFKAFIGSDKYNDLVK
jgi:hypothetical protein